jgi:hypothetical protein
MMDFPYEGMRMEPLKGETNSFGRVLDRALFLFLLDLEVKRARRYQNFLSLMFLKIEPSSREDEGGGVCTCHQALSDLLREEVRDCDIIGNLEKNRLAVLFPYADAKAGNYVKSRVEDILKHYDFGAKGFEITVDQICFPINGADTKDLINRWQI